MKSRYTKYIALDFFAGSGLVTEGLKEYFDIIWANDNCPKKRKVYTSNFGDNHFDSRSITSISGKEVPAGNLAWASFPCQDLSLAGNLKGMRRGTRSSLYYEWLRVLDEMEDKPPVLCVENVVGFLLAKDGTQFKEAYESLRERGYLAGAIIVDAIHFVPQSRPRCFLIAVREGIPISDYSSFEPSESLHPKSVISAYRKVDDENWVWWKTGPFPTMSKSLADIVDLKAVVDNLEKTKKLLELVPDKSLEKLEEALKLGETLVCAGYKRMRPGADGGSEQKLELRFDGIAGCLRTPNGGSSRQVILIVDEGKIFSRLLTVRETARLMGLRDSFKIPGTYNDGYRAMGDGVAVPVTRWLARNLLAPLTSLSRKKMMAALG